MPTDALDIEQPDQLAAYLRHTGRVAPDETVSTRVLAGGVSNKTVLVERASGEAWVLKQALPKLRVAVDWFSDPARISREALGLRYLAELAPPGATTPLVFEDPEHHLLAMKAVPQPHENWKAMLLAGRVDLGHVEQFGKLLAQVHRKAWERREELGRVFDDCTFFESLRVEPYYEYTATQVPEAAPFLSRLVADTRGRRITLVHGDYSPKNVLVHGQRLVLLDHEVIHWGDPAFDLGFALAHLLSKAHHLPPARGKFKHAALGFWIDYKIELDDPEWAADLDVLAARHTLGCLLARVAGKSVLEYLSPEERGRQRAVVASMMNDESYDSLAAVIPEFILALDAYAAD
jgi:aminoglycoside phosphotransferase (APT) family kinase protein